MPGYSRKDRKSIGLETIHRVDLLCDRFEDQFRDGKEPKIEDFLGLVSNADRPALFKELFGLELELSGRKIDQKLQEEYRRRFAEHREVVDDIFLQTTDLEMATPHDPLGSRETEFEKESPRSDALAETIDLKIDAAAVQTDRSPLGTAHRKIGSYLLMERLGFGSQGDVWKALQMEPIVRTVALKLLPTGTEFDDDRVERLRKEAERASRVGHASIPAIYEFGTANGRTYMAMQLVDGFSLSAVIRQRRSRLEGKPPADLHRLAVANESDYLQTVVNLFSRMARALGEVHGARLAHRDIKPANMLLDRTHEDGVFLADFGLARDLDNISVRPEAISGTLIYMAPEKLLGTKGADDIRADIYSLGVSLFETITLERPFNVPENLTSIGKAYFLATTEPKRPRDFRPSLTRDLEAVVMKAMDRPPSGRYESANAFADDLDRWQNGDPVLARPPSVWRKAARQAIRRRFELVVSGLILTIVLAFFATRTIIQIGESRRQEDRRVKVAQLARNADVLLKQGEFEAAFREWDRAKQLDPDDPWLRPLGGSITNRLLEDRLDSNEVDDAAKSLRVYKLWKAARGEDPSRLRPMAMFYGIGDLSVASEPPGARVTFRAMSRDGRPKNIVLNEIIAGSRRDPAILHEFIPGSYWVTAYGVDGGFSERTFRFGDGSNQQGRPSILFLRTKKRGELGAGMVRVEGGLLRMGLDRPAKDFEGKVIDLSISPAHPVLVKTFDLDQTEVRRGEFRRWYERTELIDSSQKKGLRSLLNFDDILRPEFDDYPMVRLPYRLALEFAAEEGFRLPAEEELEWAARGSVGRLKPDGLPNDWNPEKDAEWNVVHAVRSVPLDRVDIPGGSPIFGLFGNAAEMTMFRWRPYPLPSGMVPVRWGTIPGISVRSGIINNFSGDHPKQLGFVGRAILPGDEHHPYVGFRRARSLAPFFDDPHPHAQGDTR